ncbi:MAG TPA: hypothetical protein VGG75_09570 [Trebonia sp.]
MKVFLMYRDRDFDIEAKLPPRIIDLTADLGLGILLDTMAQGDDFLRTAAEHGLHDGLTSPADITYRQHVLADCAAHPDVVLELYNLAVEAITAERQVIGFFFRDSPDAILHRSRELMALQLKSLRRLADISRREQSAFGSDGFRQLFATLNRELTDDYLAEIEAHTTELELKRGALMSVRLGRGNKGTGYVLRRHPPRNGWRALLPDMQGLPGRRREAYSFTIPDRDEAGFRTLSELTSRGVNETANSLGQATDHVRGFFQLLRAELGFYLGCLNLREALEARQQPVCYPEPSGPGDLRFTARGLYDAGLALTTDKPVVGNDIDADGMWLIMITGANRGGKSTFLHGAGQAQLMAQAGMFVAAQSLQVSASTGVFTHFKREEDATMEKGKLDEELQRLSVTAGDIGPGALLLCNESFASTNEREGSEIARQIIRALTEDGVRILFVTHMYDLARSCYAANAGTSLFLRAERGHDGGRSFRLPPGEPLPTSYGEDVYREIFGTAYEKATA